MNRHEQLIARVSQGFRAAYGVDPTRIYAAPGRVNLIGEHVDYNAGLVLPCAIDRETVIALGPPDPSDTSQCIQSIALDMGGAEDEFSLIGSIEPTDKDWQNHIRGVAHFLGRQGVSVKPSRIAVGGDIPIGAGLSSSAALGVATALAFSDYASQGLQPRDLAVVAQRVENDFVGCACGIMDQMASAASVGGHAILLDCQSNQYRPVPISRSLAIVVIDSGITRQLTESAFNTRREECEKAAAHYRVGSLRALSTEQLEHDRRGLDDAIYRRARHVVSEIARVEPTAAALEQGRTSDLAQLMRASHLSLRDHFEVTVPEVDRLVDIVQSAVGENGGVRMTGAGFGGSVVAVVKQDAVETVFESVLQGYNPAAEVPATASVFEASAGASRLA